MAASSCPSTTDGDENNKDAIMKRTPRPSDWEQGFILMKRNFRNDRKSPKLWFARTLAVALFWMIYTIGFFLTYEESSNTDRVIDGDLVLYSGEAFTLPKLFYLGGSNSTLVDQVLNYMERDLDVVAVVVDEAMNQTNFKDFCEETLNYDADQVCVYLDSVGSFGLFFGGGQDIRPSNDLLSGAQHVVNSASINTNGKDGTNLYNVTQIQRIPEELKEVDGTPIGYLIVPGILLAFAAALMTMFIMAPMIGEKFQEIVEAFCRVGVKLRVYILQWVIYFSAFGVVTAAALTGVSIGWKLFSLSNGGLIFLSHYLTLIQLYTVTAFVAQIVNQEELAQGMPFLMCIASTALTTPLLVIDGVPKVVLAVLSVFSPFIGMIYYSALYSQYDWQGFETGIHPGDNVKESGLLGSLLGSAFGIVFWVGLVCLYSSPKFAQWLHRRRLPKDDRMGHQEDNEDENDAFEPLPQQSDVVLSVRNLFHTFDSVGCFKKTEPVEVLNGLDMDVCRGQVLGFLGHNGAGKSTTIRILSGELGLQSGEVRFSFADGDVELGPNQDLNTIRSKMGVCPQHNNLLGDDTCRETLGLFASLKGRLLLEPGQSKADAISAEVDRRLQDIQFQAEGDADKPVKTLSGGMKRKVSIAIALLGDPEIVFLDEPTAGMDPYNRRIIWDMITEAKRGRSIILTTHFMDEADVLSDRVAILKKGKLITCGSTLFLKHHFGVGYALSFSSPNPFDVTSYIDSAERMPCEKPERQVWNLSHGTESSFPVTLSALSDEGATNVTLELTTLEQVFLETGKEEAPTELESEGRENDEGLVEVDNERIDLDDPETKQEYLSKVWQRRGTVVPLTLWQKFNHAQNFMMSNAWKMKGAISLNIVMPLVYMLGGMLAVFLIGDPEEVTRVTPEPIPITPSLLGSEPSRFFGLQEMSNHSIAPLLPSLSPESIQDYFGGLPVSGAYWEENSTLQYNPDWSAFALQVGQQVLANYSLWQNGNSEGIVATIVQLPYDTEPFRVDFLIIPMAIVFGFSGMVLCVLDILILKSDNIIALFRVAGISEWSAYLGVMFYKCTTTFAPFFFLVVILGLAFKSVLLGNGGRWLATILTMWLYAYSCTPIGLLIAKRFVTSDFESVKNWFPSVYMTLVTLPYVAWNIAFQNAPSARDALLILGDVLCLIPPFAFQRGLAGIIEVSTTYSDPDLSWGDVWDFETRIWFALVMMSAVGTFEWIYLYRLTSERPGRTKLKKEDEGEAVPVDVSRDADVSEERDRSLANDDGINARDLVKLFDVKLPKSAEKKHLLKKAVKGVSFGIEKNEIYSLLGPNGAGKTTAMSILAGEYTPENGEVVLDGESATQKDHGVEHLFQRCNVSYCPQFDALFPRKTVLEHLRFYARVRGLDWNAESTQEHIDAIVQLLGLRTHMNKASTELSGGYKRRLSLGVAMLGYPTCMMVDECTTGMDPGARHLVWGALKPDIIHEEYDLPATLLSTHYMDEAAKLGTRIGIMIDGELVTTGTLGRLQERYCNSYFVEIALQPGAPHSAEHDVIEAFRSKEMHVQVYESLPHRFKLQVPFTNGSNNSSTKQLANIFELLETNKDVLNIKFYSVAQMNLEQIFIDLSRKQFDVEESIRALERTKSTKTRALSIYE